jgi:exodeoxyribonuclease VII large subunit
MLNRMSTLTPPPADGLTPATPAGIPGSALAGPFPVGEYAQALRTKLRSLTRVQLVGEVVNLRPARARVYFELRDSAGAVPCAAWARDWETALARAGAVKEGMQVVVAGGCDYYPGSATSSPGFSFHVTDVRVAGVGELLARIDRLRKTLDAEGLLERQRLLSRPTLPRTIGVVTGESGKAREDILAALARRGWAGRLVWAYAPVQDRHAAPAITRAVQDLAAVGGAETIVVARGGGSLADLWCFCDETLCRTVALLRVPVVASVGHHTDRTLLDDVAAVSCSTPTHAAEEAVRLHCAQTRVALGEDARRLASHGRPAVLEVHRLILRRWARRLADDGRPAVMDRPRLTLMRSAEQLATHGRRAVLIRARTLAALSRAPTDQLRRQRARLHQQLRETRAGARRRVQDERNLSARRALVLERKTRATERECRERGPRELERLRLALTGHDPQRTLERGYALVQSRDGEPLATAERARSEGDVRVRFADDTVAARIERR